MHTCLHTCNTYLLTWSTYTCSTYLHTWVLTCTPVLPTRTPGVLVCISGVLTWIPGVLTCTPGVLTCTPGVLTCTHGGGQQLVVGPVAERQGGAGGGVQTEGGQLLRIRPPEVGADPQQVVDQVGHSPRRPEDVQVGLSAGFRREGLVQVQRVQAGPVRGGTAGQPTGCQGQQHAVRTLAVTWSSSLGTVSYLVIVIRDS